MMHSPPLEAKQERINRLESPRASQMLDGEIAINALNRWLFEHDKLKQERDTLAQQLEQLKLQHRKELEAFAEQDAEPCALCQAYSQEVSALEQQLAERDTEIKWEQSACADASNMLHKVEQERDQLKQQLADKEQQLEQAVRLVTSIRDDRYFQTTLEINRWLTSPTIAPIRERVQWWGGK